MGFLITTSTVTCVSDALGLHIDEPKSNPILKINKELVETRILIPIHFLSTSNPKDPLFGRNGVGHGFLNVGLIYHSLSFIQIIIELQSYKDFRKQKQIELNLKNP